jgi:hypothetical protein
MQSIATDSSRVTRWPQANSHRIYSRPSLRTRFRRFIETSAWDEKLLSQEKWFHRICLGSLIISVLYFLPVLIASVLK